MNYYYSDTNSQPIGPIAEEQLHELFQSGSITHDSFVIAEGEIEWKAYRTIALVGINSSGRSGTNTDTITDCSVSNEANITNVTHGTQVETIISPVSSINERVVEKITWKKARLLDDNIPLYASADADAPLLDELLNTPIVEIASEVSPNNRLQISLDDGRVGFISADANCLFINRWTTAERKTVVHSEPTNASQVVAVLAFDEQLQQFGLLVTIGEQSWIPVLLNNGKTGYVTSTVKIVNHGRQVRVEEQNKYRFTCAKCNSRFLTTPEMLGTIVACPSCNTHIELSPEPAQSFLRRSVRNILNSAVGGMVVLSVIGTFCFVVKVLKKESLGSFVGDVFRMALGVAVGFGIVGFCCTKPTQKNVFLSIALVALGVISSAVVTGILIPDALSNSGGGIFLGLLAVIAGSACIDQQFSKTPKDISIKSVFRSAFDIWFH